MADRKYPLHVFWGAGEPDCPEDLKAANGELIDMRCKVCGDGWLESHEVCMAALKTVPDAERLCRALRQFVKLVPAGDECRLQLTVGAQSFFIGIEPMPEDEAAHFAGLFVLALAGMVQQVTTGVKAPHPGDALGRCFDCMWAGKSSCPHVGVMASDEAQAKRISDALRSMQEMWDHLRRKGLNEVLMREYSSALEVLEKDFMARLPDGVPACHPHEFTDLSEFHADAAAGVVVTRGDQQ